MNTLGTLSPDKERELNQQICSWSDGPGYHQATHLAESNRHLLPKPVTNAQLNGLRNIAASASLFKNVMEFTKHQGEKAERRGDFELRDYWQAVGKVLEDLKTPAGELWLGVGGSTQNLPKGKTAPDELHLRLVREFIQHLLAHSLFVKEQPEEDVRS